MSRTYLAIAAVLVTALWTGDLRAETTITVFDNYGPSWGYSHVLGTYTIGGSMRFREAMAFMPSQSGLLADLWMTTGLITVPPGLFNVWLASDGGGVPGAVLESWSAQSQGLLWGTPDPTPQFHLTSLASPVLEAGQQYWLCALTDVTTRSDGWYQTPNGQSGLTAYASGGGAWVPSSLYPQGVFRVDAMTPEPATLCLMGVGVAGLVARRFRRK